MPGCLVYGVNHAITSFSDGYAERGHGVALALSQCEVALNVLVAPSAQTAGLPFRVTVDGVDYLHLQARSEPSYQRLFSVFKPDAVLAASNWSHAQPLQQAAQQLGLPFWYEVRGFWELSHCAREPGFATSAEFEQEVAAETAIAQAAERLFTLNRQMAAEWVRRGVPAAKISLIPNGLAAIPATIPEPDPALRARLGLEGGKVIAYIGSFSAYEGLDDLIKAFAIARQQGLEARLLLVGSLSQSGNSDQPRQSSDRLLNLARQLGVADLLVFTGRVPPHTVASYYPLNDLVVIPRRPECVCEIVPPPQAPGARRPRHPAAALFCCPPGRPAIPWPRRASLREGVCRGPCPPALGHPQPADAAPLPTSALSRVGAIACRCRCAHAELL